jgi:hypothetical protein
MKYLLIGLLLLMSSTGFCQSDLMRFRIANDVMRLKLPDGKWDEWKALGNINEDMRQGVIVSLENHKLIWVSKFKQDEPRTTNYFIKNIEQDTTYKEMGFWTFVIHAQDPKNENTNFRFFFDELGGKPTFTLIFGSELVQSKCELQPE